MIGHTLQTFWTRLTRQKYWAEEVAALHNIEGGGTPAPGERRVARLASTEFVSDPARSRREQPVPR